VTATRPVLTYSDAVCAGVRFGRSPGARPPLYLATGSAWRARCNCRICRGFARQRPEFAPSIAATCDLRRLSRQRKSERKCGFAGGSRSPLTDSNRRPPPYHGDCEPRRSSLGGPLYVVLFLEIAGLVRAVASGLESPSGDPTYLQPVPKTCPQPAACSRSCRRLGRSAAGVFARMRHTAALARSVCLRSRDRWLLRGGDRRVATQAREQRW
jgi:hypothetical protein